MKKCSRCCVSKDFSGFGKSPGHKDGFHGVCKECKNEQRRIRGRRETKEQRKRYSLRSLYGISLEEFNERLEDQGGCCYICNVSKENAAKGTLYVDHCHYSGKVRRLLCSHCNVGLGSFKDDKVLLKKAIEYLDQFQGI